MRSVVDRTELWMPVGLYRADTAWFQLQNNTRTHILYIHTYTMLLRWTACIFDVRCNAFVPYSECVQRTPFLLSMRMRVCTTICSDATRKHSDQKASGCMPHNNANACALCRPESIAGISQCVRIGCATWKWPREVRESPSVVVVTKALSETPSTAYVSAYYINKYNIRSNPHAQHRSMRAQLANTCVCIYSCIYWCTTPLYVQMVGWSFLYCIGMMMKWRRQRTIRYACGLIWKKALCAQIHSELFVRACCGVGNVFSI